METFGLENKKVTPSTYKDLANFIYNNRAELHKSPELLFFYNDVRSILDRELSKKAANRLTMSEIMERAYNIEQYVLAAGAISFETQFVVIKN